MRNEVSRRTGAVLATCGLIAALAAPPLDAQYRELPAPPAWALTDVTVWTPGGLQPGMTVVVRDGRIETLAAGAPVPADAELLEGDGLHLYPGIVDAHGDAEVSWPEARDVEDDDQVTAWAPPRSRQGFMPHRRVADHLTALGSDLEDRRENGVVASLVHASGGMAPGQPAVLVHRDAGMPWELVENDAAGLTMSLQTAGGVYPSQLFGVIAYLRQAFLDAERYAAMRAAQASGSPTFVPSGWDPDWEALNAATAGELPVWFVADSDEDIRRALNLADEFGYPLAIVGGAEAWKHAEELARRDVAVYVSLDFDDPDDWDPEEEAGEAELSPAALREKRELENVYSNAARLAEAGVTFALTSGGGDADFMEGLAKVVEYGLSPDDALAAVTSTPAALLGISGIVRVEEGAPATFMVATGPLFGEEEAGVAWTFVEGHLTEGSGSGSGGGEGDPPAANLAGGWSGTIEAGGQEAGLTFQVEQDDEGGLSGTVSSDQLPPSDFTGRISGSEVTIDIEVPEAGITLTLTGAVSEDGNTISGDGDSPFGPLAFTVTRDGGGAVDWLRFLGGGR